MFFSVTDKDIEIIDISFFTPNQYNYVGYIYIFNLPFFEGVMVKVQNSLYLFFEKSFIKILVASKASDCALNSQWIFFLHQNSVPKLCTVKKKF